MTDAPEKSAAEIIEKIRQDLAAPPPTSDSGGVTASGIARDCYDEIRALRTGQNGPKRTWGEIADLISNKAGRTYTDGAIAKAMKKVADERAQSERAARNTPTDGVKTTRRVVKRSPKPLANKEETRATDFNPFVGFEDRGGSHG